MENIDPLLSNRARISVQEEIKILNRRIRTALAINNDQAHKSSETSEDEEETRKEELCEILRLIECPVCKEVPSPPIYNCVNGHFVCSDCRPKLPNKRCAYCQGKFTRMRNYPLESLVSTPVLSCQFTKFGCARKKLTLLEYEKHVDQCWGQIWRPGKIVLLSKMKAKNGSYSNDIDDNHNSFPCPKCYQENSARKIKCRNCECSLRPPTPMKVSQFNFSF